ncbi:MAG TPA: ATP-binding protein [Nitrospiraceae bacterium]
MQLKLNRDESVPQQSSPLRTVLRFLAKALYGQEGSIIALVLLFILAIAGLSWKMFSLSDDLARELVLQGTELQSVAMEEIRHYYSSEVVARIKDVDGIEVAHDYATKIHAIPLPATMSIELGKRIGARELGLQVRLYSDYPFPWRSDGGPRDEFETDALRALRQHPDRPYYRFEHVGSEWRLRYAKADLMQASCIECHNSHPASPKRDWQEGNVRGVLEVVRPISESVSLVRGQLQTSFALIGLTGVLGLCGLTFATLKIRRYGATLERLVGERTADLAAETHKAKLAVREKAQILATVEAFFIGVTDQGAISEWTNRAEETFGIPLREAIGRSLRDLPIAWSWDEILDAVSKTGDSLMTVRLEKVRLTVPGAKEKFLKLTISPICEDKGIGYVIMGEDVTDRLVLEDELVQAQKLESIGHLAAGIAHEINTPTQFVGDNVRFLSDSFSDIGRLIEQYRSLLTAAKTGACPDTLIETCDATNRGADVEYLLAEIPKAIEQTLEGIDRVATIVRAMKDFSHPGSTEKTAIDINRAIESTVTVARNEWKYVADLHTDLDRSLPPVPCLVGEFNQVVLNMIVNATHAIADAVKGTGGKGTITISTSRVGDFVEVRITDTGMGIPDSIRHRIFDPFFTTKEVGRGTGQGLSIARSVVVRKHGGSIAVDSEVGKGTTFLIRLPLKPLPADSGKEGMS